MMERSKLDKAYDHISGIIRNYPHWPCTFGPCTTEGCNNSARGGRYCADCHERKLAEYVGTKLASKFLLSIAETQSICHEIRDKLEEE